LLLKRWRLLAIGLAAIGLLAAGVQAARVRLAADHAMSEMKAQYVRPQGLPPAPEDNQSTPDRVALGRQLFFDPRLSGNGAMSCASCHAPNRDWQDGIATAIGRDGRILARRTPTLLNAAWGFPFFWDGRADTLEQQAVMPIEAPGEMNLPHAQAAARIGAVPGYREAFALAYSGEGVTISTIGKAIAAFERTLVSGQAPFDRWIAGDERAISPQARRGFILFNTSARCSTCHSGWRFTDDGFHDIGVGADDEGRAAIAPGIEQLRFAFKTPTLRNIDRRGPYMHNGSLQSLEAVVAFYNMPPATNRPSLSPDLTPLHLSASEQGDLVAFLRALTSEDATEHAPALPQ
jgi:cytochrome c peroxidase